MSDQNRPDPGQDSRVEDWFGQSVDRDAEVAEDVVAETGAADEHAEDEFERRASGAEEQAARHGERIDPDQGRSAYADEAPSDLAGTWHLDADATEVTVSSKNFLIKTVDAQLDVISGEATVDTLGSGRLKFSLDARSFDTGTAKRDEHIRSDDFLDADRFPTIDFASDRVTRRDGQYVVTGTLTVAGSPAPIELRVHDVRVDDGRATFEASASVDRRQIGVGKLPAVVIGNELRIHARGVATRV